MRIPLSERQERIRANKEEAIRRQNEKPRFALRLARFFTDKDYDEESWPAWTINTIYIAGMVFTTAVTILGVYLVWHYPWTMCTMFMFSIWPIGSLMYLNNHDHILQHEGVVNPKGERTIAWMALFSLSLAAACAILAQYSHYKGWYAGTGIAVFVYAFITYCTFFEFSPPPWVSKAREWLVWISEEIVTTIAGGLAYFILTLFKISGSKKDGSNNFD